MVKDNNVDIFKQAEEFWQDLLQDEITVNALHSVSENETQVQYENFCLSNEVGAKIEKISKGNDIAIYMILLAAYDILLYRYTDVKNNVVVSPVLENNSNGYNKFVLFRQKIQVSDTFKTLLGQVKKQVTAGYRNQFYPIRKIIEKKDENYVNRIMNFVLVYNNIHHYDNMKTIVSRFTNQLFLSVTKEEGSFHFSLEYKQGLMERVEAQRMIKALELILSHVVNNADGVIGEMEILTPEEKNKILNVFNDTKVSRDYNTNIIEEFEHIVEENPEKCCLTFIKKKGDSFVFPSNLCSGE